VDNYGDNFGLSGISSYFNDIPGKRLKIGQYVKPLITKETFWNPCQGYENKGDFVTLP
jgi:hypothetical protein